MPRPLKLDPDRLLRPDPATRAYIDDPPLPVDCGWLPR